MTEKEPVLLVTQIETQTLRWRIGAVELDGTTHPLICSRESDLAGYEDQELDDQVTFLRHRFAGALQIGCDRLRARGERPCRFVFVCDGGFPQAAPGLDLRFAEHMAQWMANPPVAFYETDESRNLNLLAGTMGTTERDMLLAALKELSTATEDPRRWELIDRS